jgi:hypothetical protein
MKKIALALSAFALIVSCQSNHEAENEKREPAPDTVVADGVYGQEFDAENAISMDSLESLMAAGQPIELVKVSGQIKEVCQAEGCWMTIQKKDGNGMRVTFNDHAFFIPKDLAGKTAMFEGKAYIETTSVEDLRHYAEDEGKSKEDIAKITEPLSELVFDARGVMIR